MFNSLTSWLSGSSESGKDREGERVSSEEAKDGESQRQNKTESTTGTSWAGKTGLPIIADSGEVS